MFLFLCICHTSTIETILYPKLREPVISLFEMKECLKLYLAMDEWFHDTNSKEEVRNARILIGHTIDMVKKLFPRGGNRWNFPKTYGLTKMQYCMCLFSSAINFYGSPGECNHKTFFKDTGTNTQHRSDYFTSQVAQQYYETILVAISKQVKDEIFAVNYKSVGGEGKKERRNSQQDGTTC